MKSLLLGCGNSRVKKLYVEPDKEFGELTTLDINKNCGADVVFDLDLLTARGVNKIVFVSHLQNLANDRELVALLRRRKGVDRVVVPLLRVLDVLFSSGALNDVAPAFPSAPDVFALPLADALRASALAPAPDAVPADAVA